MIYSSGRHDNVHGDEHLTQEPSDRENKEQFYILLRDIVTNANYLEKVNMFTPDSDDMEAIEALHDFMYYHLQRALAKDFRDSRAREALEDNN